MDGRELRPRSHPPNDRCGWLPAIGIGIQLRTDDLSAQLAPVSLRRDDLSRVDEGGHAEGRGTGDLTGIEGACNGFDSACAGEAQLWAHLVPIGPWT